MNIDSDYRSGRPWVRPHKLASYIELLPESGNHSDAHRAIFLVLHPFSGAETMHENEYNRRRSARKSRG